jgi:hypothetical protein
VLGFATMRILPRPFCEKGGAVIHLVTPNRICACVKQYTVNAADNADFRKLEIFDRIDRVSAQIYHEHSYVQTQTRKFIFREGTVSAAAAEAKRAGFQ